MSSEICLHSFARSAWLHCSGGRNWSMGTPLMVALDHAATWVSPWTPMTDSCIELLET
jgi:hypothetical protein